MAGLLGSDFEVEGAGSAAKHAALGSRPEAHKAGTAGGDTHGGRIEAPIDATCGIDQTNPAAGEAVAVVLHHELVAGSVSRPDHRLQRNDSSMVERSNVKCCLGDDALIGFVRRDGANADDCRPGGR